MAKKDFLLAMGERSVNPVSTDELLRSKISERKRKELDRQEEIDDQRHKSQMAELKKKETAALEEQKRIDRMNQSPGSQKPNEKEEDKSEWERKAKEAKSEREYLEEQRRIDRMAQLPDSQSHDEGGKDPLAEAQKFTKQMAAGAIIESEVAKAKASAEKATAEAEEAKAKVERARSGEGKTKETPKEAPLKVTGSVDLGHFNYQEILQQQQRDLKELKKEAEDQAGRQAAVSNELREKLHEKEMEVLKTSFGAQMQVLTKMIETNASRGNFMEQYSTVIETAKALGYSQPQMAGDLSSQVELKKMEFNQAMELKKMARDERRADREFQRQLNRDADEREQRLNRDVEEREDKKDERAQQARRDDMIAKTPQYIGGAIAQGLLANQGKGGMVTEEASSETKAPRGKQAKHVEAGWDESGEVECPGCTQPIAIGPTARTAVCTNCGERVPIRRVGERPSAGEEE